MENMPAAVREVRGAVGNTVLVEGEAIRLEFPGAGRRRGHRLSDCISTGVYTALTGIHMEVNTAAWGVRECRDHVADGRRFRLVRVIEGVHPINFKEQVLRVRIGTHRRKIDE